MQKSDSLHGTYVAHGDLIAGGKNLCRARSLRGDVDFYLNCRANSLNAYLCERRFVCRMLRVLRFRSYIRFFRFSRRRDLAMLVFRKRSYSCCSRGSAPEQVEQVDCNVYETLRCNVRSQSASAESKRNSYAIAREETNTLTLNILYVRASTYI